MGLQAMLRKDEFVLADGGYTDERCISPQGPMHPDHEAIATIHARDEQVNKRLKQFFVLSNRFRHKQHLHVHCCHAFLGHLSLQSGG